MSKVEEIIEAITRLPNKQRARLEELLLQTDWREWDTQIIRDFRAGKLRKMIARVDADIDAGRLDDGP